MFHDALLMQDKKQAATGIFMLIRQQEKSTPKNVIICNETGPDSLQATSKKSP